MKKRYLLLILVLSIVMSIVVASIAVAAEDFTVNIDPVDNRIDTLNEDEFATYIITIKNLQGSKDRIHLLHQQDTRWSMQVTGTRSPDLFHNEEAQIRVILKPRVFDLPNAGYQVKFSFESENTGEVKNFYTKLFVGPDLSKLKPDFEVAADVPSSMDPRKSHAVKVFLTNNNQLDLENILVMLDSAFISEQTTVSLAGNEAKTVSFTVTFPEDREPESDTAHIKVLHENKSFLDQTFDWAVGEYVLPFAKQVETKKGFLTRTKTITLTNEGNTIKEDQEIKLETSARESFFSKPVGGQKIKEGEKRYFLWTVTLDAGASTELKVKTAYWWPVIVIIIIALLYVAYIMMRDPIVVKKKVKGLKRENSAFAEAKIIVHVKNRTHKLLKDVKIIERVPGMLALKKDGFKPMGPAKAYPHVSHGHVLEYPVGVLDGRDERVFSYVIKSKLRVVGNFKIKPTVVKFTDKEGKRRKVIQGALDVLVEEK